MATDNLLPPESWRKSWVSAEGAVRAIHAIRSRCNTPVTAVSVFPRDEGALLRAGVECVVRMPFEREKLRFGVRRVLRMTELVEVSKPTRSSLAELVFRGCGTVLLQAKN